MSSNASTNRSSPIGSPSIAMRSRSVVSSGLVYRPVRSPRSRSSDSMSRAVLDLPFVPAMWITGYARCGSPRTSTRSRIRSRVGSISHSTPRAMIAPTVAR